MPLSDLIAIETLREPLALGGAAGLDPWTDSDVARLWREARDWRAEARQMEKDADSASISGAGSESSSQDATRSAAVPKWRQIAQRSVELLRDKTRHLGVAALLVEALARLEGFGGIADASDLARVMVESQWGDLFPSPDPEDGPADDATIATERGLPLVQLVGEDAEGLLVTAIMHIPLVDGRNGERFGLGHWRIRDSGSPSAADFASAAGDTDPGFLRETFLSIGRARKAWSGLAEAVSTASGGLVVVPTLPFETLFDECEDAMRTFAAAAIAEVSAPTAADDALPASETRDLSGDRSPPLREVLVPAGARRHDVLRLLETVAEYFEFHDPHSLLAAQVRNVVRLARLPRDEYYREMIRDQTGLESLARVSGLNFDGDGNSGAG